MDSIAGTNDTPNSYRRSSEIDTDTARKGRKGPYEDWEGDHTALVHVLWSARHAGLSLDNGEDTDKIASMILRSRWFYAAQQLREPAGNA